MSIIVQHTFAPDCANLLEANRDDHRAYVAEWADKLQLTAIITGKAESELQGSIFVLRSNDLEEAHRFADGDPFLKAGVVLPPYVGMFEKRRGWND